MYDPTNSLSDNSTNISIDITSKREATQNPFESADSARVYWAWTKSSKFSDKYALNPVSVPKSIATNHGPKVYYENSAFGTVAGIINTGSPSSSYNSIWGIQARFLAFSNAQVVLLDNIEFFQTDGTKSILPQNFTRREIP